MHTPVLLQEILDIFNPKPGETYIDATVNGGGHARALLEKVQPKGEVLGIDRDCDLIARLKKEGLNAVCGNYANLVDIAANNNVADVAGVLFDLGFSSYHVDQSGRGFSFQSNEPLDMRYNPDESPETAADIVHTRSQDELERMLREYGEERFAKNIAKAIVLKRKKARIETTHELSAVIREAIPARFQHQKIHYATRTFQALRIAVNDELAHIEQGLESACAVVAPGAKIAVISFHSLEDRIVKKSFREFAHAGRVEILTKKPVCATDEEIRLNPRARSAKLRAVQMLT